MYSPALVGSLLGEAEKPGEGSSRASSPPSSFRCLGALACGEEQQKEKQPAQEVPKEEKATQQAEETTTVEIPPLDQPPEEIREQLPEEIKQKLEELQQQP